MKAVSFLHLAMEHHASFRKLFKGWRTCRYFGRNLGRLSKDYERKVQTSETLIHVAMIRLLLARLGWKS
jgi:hypothetical protein